MLLTADDLKAHYGAAPVLHDVSFGVREGEITVLLGANGAGKTTTLRAISGTVAVAGEISFDGRSLRGLAPERIAASGIAHVPQGRGTFTELTVEENLRLGGHRRSRAEVKNDVKHWYGVFPRLAERRGQRAGSLSGGEQQMLAIARALMSRPRLLLLDEPSLGLAPIITQELFRQLAEINRDSGTTMLIVEQNANLALRAASAAFVMETGRVVASGTAEALLSDDGVRRAYLGY